jgi:hypothetical protein
MKRDCFERHSKKGQVKCHESNELTKHEELNVDHRQPNTFSVIVERFVELNSIDFEKIEYIQVAGKPNVDKPVQSVPLNSESRSFGMPKNKVKA